MTVTGAAISSTSIVLTGTGFPTSSYAYTAVGSYNGTDATSYMLNSDTQATLVFSEGGIPFATD